MSDDDELREAELKCQQLLEETRATFRSADKDEKRPQLLEQTMAACSSFEQLLNKQRDQLAPYLREKYSKTGRLLSVELNDLKQRIQPRKKFAFRSKKKESQPVSDAVDASAAATAAVVATDENDDVCLPIPTVCNRTGELITVPCSSTDLVFVGLRQCTVRAVFCQPVSSVILRDIDECTIVLGCLPDHQPNDDSGNGNQDDAKFKPVQGPISVRNMVNGSVLVAPGRQVRLDRCADSKIFLLSPPATSVCVLEKCSNIEVGSVENAPDHEPVVNDFDWLRSTPSPNWKRINDQPCPF